MWFFLRCKHSSMAYLPFGRFLQAWPQYKVATIKLNQELLQMHHVPLKEKRRHAWAISFTHFCPNTSRWHTGADVRASTSMIRISSPIINWSWILVLSLINHVLIFSLFLMYCQESTWCFFCDAGVPNFSWTFFGLWVRCHWSIDYRLVQDSHGDQSHKPLGWSRDIASKCAKWCQLIILWKLFGLLLLFPGSFSISSPSSCNF